MKVCKTCKKYLMLDKFSKHSHNTDGLQGSCKICSNKYYREWLAKNKDKKHLQQRKWLLKNKLIKPVQCACCLSVPLLKYITVCPDCFNLVAMAQAKKEN